MRSVPHPLFLRARLSCVLALLLLVARLHGQTAEEILTTSQTLYINSDSLSLHVVSARFTTRNRAPEATDEKPANPVRTNRLLRTEYPSRWLILEQTVKDDGQPENNTASLLSRSPSFPPVSGTLGGTANRTQTLTNAAFASRLDRVRHALLPSPWWRPDNDEKPAPLQSIAKRKDITRDGYTAWQISCYDETTRYWYLLTINKENHQIERSIARREAPPPPPGSGTADDKAGGDLFTATGGDRTPLPSAKAADFEIVETIFFRQEFNPSLDNAAFTASTAVREIPLLDKADIGRLTDNRNLITAALGIDQLPAPDSAGDAVADNDGHDGDDASGPSGKKGGKAASRARNETPAGQLLSPGQMAGIVLIQSRDGAATGFMTRLRGVDFIVTNLHVLSGSEGLTFRNLRGETIAAGPAFGAVGSDIALLRIEKAEGSLSASPDVMKTARIGDKVVVVGNRLGSGVATQVSGLIQGVGPTLVEVNATFQPGNSGSPIFDLTTGEVIGVASYAETRKINIEATYGTAARKSASSDTEIEKRWFGYRIDSVKKWESLDLDEFNRQAARIAEFREFSESLLELVQLRFGSARLHPRLSPLFYNYEDQCRRMAGNRRGLMSETQSFLRTVRSLAEASSRELKPETFYDYYRTCQYWENSITAQKEFRSRLVEALKQYEANTSAIVSRLGSGGR
ncbi:MAG: serine protease [Opitutaceae bacterium]|jgi:serine protease Do|nr:serine protease [Opitutaceae bacterium]